jgi:hypothetical protein
VDLLDEAVGRMEASLRERIAESKANISLEEVHGVAEAIGYGAVKYFDLSRNPKSNYKFSYDQMLDTKGNTAGESFLLRFLCDDTFDWPSNMCSCLDCQSIFFTQMLVWRALLPRQRLILIWMSTS